MCYYATGCRIVLKLNGKVEKQEGATKIKVKPNARQTGVDGEKYKVFRV